MSFERCTEVMMKCFITLHKDPDQCYSNQQKVEKLLKANKCQDAELLMAKAIIDQQFPCDYVGACGYFSNQVAWIHGPAQLEYWNTRNKIYATDTANPVEAAEHEAILAFMAAEVVVYWRGALSLPMTSPYNGASPKEDHSMCCTTHWRYDTRQLH
jgi:hypothetical protein